MYPCWDFPFSTHRTGKSGGQGFRMREFLADDLTCLMKDILISGTYIEFSAGRL